MGLPDWFVPQSTEMRRLYLHGRREEKKESILRLLTRRFGVLSDDVRELMAQSSIEELDAMFDRSLEAETLDEALGRR